MKIIFSRVAKIISPLIVTLIFASPVVAWGPERTTFTNDSPAPYVTFDSITDNTGVGDERNFVRVRELGTDETYKDEVQVTPGKEYEVYIYYHNNAASNLNASGKGISNGTKVASAYPTNLKKGEKGMISGIISATDANPEKIWDEAYLTTDSDNVVLKYKTGTAIIHNAGKVNGSVLSQNLFTSEGTYIGINKLDGRIPGCAEYSGYITYTLVAENTSVSLDKKVSLDGENWSETVSIDPYGIATYWVTFKNTGNTTLTNVIFKDTHDEKLSLVFGTTKIYDSNNLDGKQIDDILDISGYNVGDVAPGAMVQLTYQLRVSGDAECGQTLKNTISADYNSTEQIADEASLVIKGDCTPPTPAEDCTTNPDLPGCKKDCTTNPELPECQRIPDTGPVEIILAIVIVLGLGGAGYYFYRTHKKVKAVEKKVSGKTPEESTKDKAPEAPKAESSKAEEAKAPEAKPEDKKSE